MRLPETDPIYFHKPLPEIGNRLAAGERFTLALDEPDSFCAIVTINLVDDRWHLRLASETHPDVASGTTYTYWPHLLMALGPLAGYPDWVLA